VALARLGRPAEAAASLEQALEMNPALRQAYLEFDQVATVLRDFERCRRVAQKLVDQGSYWRNCWQRPVHFYAGAGDSSQDLASRPWHDPADFALARCLEASAAVIMREFQALSTGQERWGRVGSSDRGN
ncbi:unnamed protein product, partial [Polarella glacialis]